MKFYYKHFLLSLFIEIDNDRFFTLNDKDVENLLNELPLCIVEENVTKRNAKIEAQRKRIDELVDDISEDLEYLKEKLDTGRLKHKVPAYLEPIAKALDDVTKVI